MTVSLLYCPGISSLIKAFLRRTVQLRTGSNVTRHARFRHQRDGVSSHCSNVGMQLWRSQEKAFNFFVYIFCMKTILMDEDIYSFSRREVKADYLWFEYSDLHSSFAPGCFWIACQFFSWTWWIIVGRLASSGGRFGNFSALLTCTK